MKILNLYSGIGGNRKLWGDENITAVEYDEEIAEIYKDHFPYDTVIVGDAHEYLLRNYKDFDFIWASPPCQSHSDIRRMGVVAGMYEAKFPDMKLWSEIVFLKHHFKGKYVVENVVPYYEPFVKPSIQIQRHLFWSNFRVAPIRLEETKFNIRKTTVSSNLFGYDLAKYKIKARKSQLLRNCVNPDLGLYILEQAQGVIRSETVVDNLLFY